MNNSVVNVPNPINEPIRTYEAGSSDRQSLKNKLVETDYTPWFSMFTNVKNWIDQFKKVLIF